MATQKVDISRLLSGTQKIAKSHFNHYLPLSLLFIFPFSLFIVAYPTLQHSLATTGLFLAYLFALFCLLVCAIGTVTYSVYHGLFGKPVRLDCAIKSLSNSIMRLFATFFCAHTIILVGLVVGLIVYGVTSGIEYIVFGIRYHSFCSKIFFMLGFMLLGFGVLYMYVDWVLAPVIVVVESNWGLEPLKRSAYLVKGNRGVVVRLLVSNCAMTCLTVFGLGTWGQTIPFGSNKYESTLLVVTMSYGSYLLTRHFLHSLIAITIFYTECKALQGELPKDVNREFISLPLGEEKVPLLFDLFLSSTPEFVSFRPKTLQNIVTAVDFLQEHLQWGWGGRSLSVTPPAINAMEGGCYCGGGKTVRQGELNVERPSGSHLETALDEIQSLVCCVILYGKQCFERRVTSSKV